MGRAYYVDDAVQKYFRKVVEQRRDVVTGLLLGQSSVQRDHIVLAVRTPPVPDPCEDGAAKPEVDEEWFCIHAGQVSRMLPGGLRLLGVFLVSPPEFSKESPNLLRKLVFAAEKFAVKEKLWAESGAEISDRVALQICSSTNKIVCRTFDVKDPKSSARPAEWKYQNVSSSWLVVQCNLHVDLSVLLPKSATYPEQQKCTRVRLADWGKEMDDWTILINGEPRDRDGELLEETKKGKSAANSSRPIMTATILSPSRVSSRGTARVQPCNSSLNIRGVVRCRGYICNNKPKVKDAIQVLRRDLLDSLCARCDVMFEDFALNASTFDPASSPLPQRVFIPLPGSGAALCDYVIGEETKDELRSRLLEMLDLEVNYEDFEFAEEKLIAAVGDEQIVHKSGDPPSDRKCAARKEISSSKFPQTIGIVLATGVVLLAILVYFLK